MTTGRLIDLMLEIEESDRTFDPKKREKKEVRTMASLGVSYEAIKLTKHFRTSTTYSGIGKLLRMTDSYFRRAVNYSKFAQNHVIQKIEEQLLAYETKKRNIAQFSGTLKVGINVQATWYWLKEMSEFPLERPLEEIFKGRLQRLYKLVATPEITANLDDKERWRKLELRLSMALKSKDNKNTVSLYSEMLELYPNNIEIISEFAKFLKTAEMNQEAIELYKQLLIHLPYDEESLQGLAELYKLTGNQEQSIYYLRRTEFESPANHEVLALLGDLYSERNELEHAYFYYLRYTEIMGPFESHQKYTEKLNNDITSGTFSDIYRNNPQIMAKFECAMQKRREIQRNIESYYAKANELAARNIEPIRPE